MHPTCDIIWLLPNFASFFQRVCNQVPSLPLLCFTNLMPISSALFYTPCTPFHSRISFWHCLTSLLPQQIPPTFPSMDQLRAIFPDLDHATLQATLEAHGNSVERAVDYLLSSRDDPRAVQEAEDEALARRLQAEDLNDSPSNPSFSFPRTFQSRQTNSAYPRDSSSTNPSFSIPSLADVQSAVRPIVNGVMYAGKVAADSVTGLYNEYIGESSTSSRPPTSASRPDESVVIRGEASPPAATRNTARQRRPDAASLARSQGDKKDD